MDELDASGAPRRGSLLMSGVGATDRHGRPYQVILKLRPGGGTEDLVRDDHGRVLGWVFDEEGRPLGSERGPYTQPVPPDVSDAAEQWLRDQPTGP